MWNPFRKKIYTPYELEKAKILKIILADAEIRYDLVDRRGRTCAIGGLLKANYVFELLDGNLVVPAATSICIELSKLYPLVFGGYRGQSRIGDIMATNDRFSLRSERHQQLKKLIDRWRENEYVALSYP